MTHDERPTTMQAEIDALRAHAAEHPVLTTLHSVLPAYGPDAALAHGLYFDRAPAPGIRIGDEHRVSVARIVSVTHEGESLVGQCQVVARVVAGKKKWSVRWYAHNVSEFWTETFEDVHAWWLSVLERHIERGGEPPAMPAHVSA